MRYLWLACAICNALVASAGAGELFVTRMAGRVAPEQVAAVSAVEPGEVEVCCRESGRVKAGTLLVRINPEELALDEAEMELQISQRRLESENEILKLTREKEEMDFILSLPEKKRLYVTQQMEIKADERAVALLNKRIELAREQLRLQEEKLRSTFDKKAALRVIRMPFDGRVQYHVTVPPAGERALVASGAPVLTVADDSALYIAVPIADPALAQLPPERLCVRLDGAGMAADWVHKRVEKSGQTETLVYYFRVPAPQSHRAWELLGSNLIVELWCRGEENWRYEEKAALALEAGDQPFETWEELVAALRPGYVVVFSGETHLALRPQQQEES